MNELSLKEIVKYVKNKTNNNNNFNTIEETFEDIIKLGANKFLSYGTHTLCFTNNNNKLVIKCCRKAKETILTSKEKLINSVGLLCDLGFPLLKPIDIIEKNNFIIYTQKYCKQLKSDEISPAILKEILEYVLIMLENNVKIADIYYKNFGMYYNKLYLFDFHNVEDFTNSNSNFLITNLYCLFIRTGYDYYNNKKDWNVPNISISTTTKIKEDNYGKTKFPYEFYKVLKNLALNNHEESKKYILKTINYLDINITKTDYNLYINSPFKELINLIDPINILITYDNNTIIENSIIKYINFDENNKERKLFINNKNNKMKYDLYIKFDKNKIINNNNNYEYIILFYNNIVINNNLIRIDKFNNTLLYTYKQKH